MDFYIVTWKNDKLHAGKKDFLVKDAFDNNDAIVKVRRQISPEWSEPGESFKSRRVVFNEQNTFAL
jgi:hypothetical protein